MDPGIGQRTERLAWALVRWPEVWVVLVPVLYTLAVLASPALAMAGMPDAAEAAFTPFRFFCHQLPHRTLHVGGYAMAVCARCFALTAGVAATGLGVGQLRRRGVRLRAPAWAVAVAAIPLVVDGISQLFGFRESTNTLRVASGALFGAMVSLWCVPQVCEAFEGMKPERESA